MSSDSRSSPISLGRPQKSPRTSPKVPRAIPPAGLIRPWAQHGQSFYDQRPHGEDYQFHWLENVCCQQDAFCSDFGALTNIRFSAENRGKFTLNRFRIGNYSYKYYFSFFLSCFVFFFSFADLVGFFLASFLVSRGFPIYILLNRVIDRDSLFLQTRISWCL